MALPRRRRLSNHQDDNGDIVCGHSCILNRCQDSSVRQARSMAKHRHHQNPSEQVDQNHKSSILLSSNKIQKQQKCWKGNFTVFCNELSSLPRGTWTHLINVGIAVALLLFFVLYDYHCCDCYYYVAEESRRTRMAMASSSSLLSPTTKISSFLSSRTSLQCIYFSQLGLIYDNGVNAMGRYLGPGRLLRLLHKYRFVWHVTAMPLLAIPVTEIATRQSIYETPATPEWIVLFLLAWSWIDFTKWHLWHDPQTLCLVDIRSSPGGQGCHYMAGTLTYTTSASNFCEMALPPLLLVLYELVIGTAILWGFPCSPQDGAVNETFTTILASSFKTTALLLLPSPAVTDTHFSSSCEPPISAIFLSLSGILTLLTSGLATLGYPELQLFGENLHGVLLWAAYVAVDQD